MTPDLLMRLRSTVRGGSVPKIGVTGVPGVTGAHGYASELLPLRRLRGLRAQDWKQEEGSIRDVTEGVSAPSDLTDLIEERAAIAEHDGGVPRAYCDAWARLQCQKPLRVSDSEWRVALDDGGRFLDGWGPIAAELGWPPGAIFDLPRGNETGGLIWLLRGASVVSLAAYHARLDDRRTINRQPTRGPQPRGTSENLRSSS